MEIASLNLEEEETTPKVRRSLRRRSGVFEFRTSIAVSTPSPDHPSNDANLSLPLELETTKEPFKNDLTTPTSSFTSSKRRVVKNPRKRKNPASVDSIAHGIKEYYLCKKIKRMPNSFETIFEEPVLQKNKVVTIGAKKQKRLLVFNNTLKEKLKNRRNKIKKQLPSQGFLKRKRVTMEFFLEKMEAASPESDSDRMNQTI